MRHDVLEVKPNEPVEITLAFDDGRDISKPKFPPCVMYKLTDGRVMFVPPEARNAIANAGVKRNEPFTLLKLETVNGTRKVEWKVGRTTAQQEAVEAANPQQMTPSRLQRALIAAVDAAFAAQQHAKQIGFSAMPQFTGEDLRTMANCAIIEAGRCGR